MRITIRIINQFQVLSISLFLIIVDPGEDCIYAHIDMDCYFVQIALLNAPQYQDQPVAVSSGER